MWFGLCRGQPAKCRDKGATFDRVPGDCIKDSMKATCIAAFYGEHGRSKAALGGFAAEAIQAHLPSGITRNAQAVDVGLYPVVEFHQITKRKMRRADGPGSEMQEESRFFSKLGDYSLSNQEDSPFLVDRHRAAPDPVLSRGMAENIVTLDKDFPCLGEGDARLSALQNNFVLGFQ